MEEDYMPTTVSELFANVNLEFDGPVRWSQPVKNRRPGVYVVSTSNDPEKHLGLQSTPFISIEIIGKWIQRVPSIELDGVRNPAAIDIADRLAEFWLPDESILYIGMTNTKVQTRINQYYSTPLGDRRPHVGGHWLKTLSNLSELFLYHADCEAPKSIEDQLLDYFVSNVSDDTMLRLRDPEHPFPFANLAYPQGTKKQHGIGKSTL
jgi:hypothetical protein